MYEVILLPKAGKAFANAEKPLASKLARCFRILEETPATHPNIKKLKGPLSGFFRFHVGDYRVLYSVEDAEKKVYVIRIVHRREAYE